MALYQRSRATGKVPWLPPQKCFRRPIALFEYKPGGGQEHPQAFLGSYRGIVMSDG